MNEAVVAEIAAALTPRKVTMHNGQFVVGGKSFDTRLDAVAALHDYYVQTVGRETAAKPKPKRKSFRDAHDAMRKPHAHRPIKGLVHTSFVYGGAGSINGGGVYDPLCADCGQPSSSPGHTDTPSPGVPSGPSASGGTATALLEEAGGYPCACGRDFASAVAFARHLVTLAEVEEVEATEIAAVTMSDGSYPISDQKSANSAWKLRKHSKSHSEQAVLSHIRTAVKKLGLKMPGPSDTAGHEYACLPCDRWFGTQDALVGHITVLHR